MTPHLSPYVRPVDEADAARAWARYQDALARASKPRPAPTPPPATAREHAWLFVQSALAMGLVVAVLLAVVWIGGGR